MLIVSLEKQKKHLVKLGFSDGSSCLLDIGVCTDNSICTGTDIQEEMLQRLCFESDFRRAKSRALWYLDRSDYTANAIHKKLVTAKFSKEAAAAAIARLEELGIIDDRRFAERFCERCAERNISKREMFYKMLEKGVNYELAKEMLDETEVDEQTQLKNLIEGKYASRLCGERGTEKVFAALVRKGFSYSSVRSALREYGKESELNGEYDV